MVSRCLLLLMKTYFSSKMIFVVSGTQIWHQKTWYVLQQYVHILESHALKYNIFLIQCTVNQIPVLLDALNFHRYTS